MLARRIARPHGWQKTGPRIRERVDALDAQNHPATQEDVGTSCWPLGKGSETPPSRPAGSPTKPPGRWMNCLSELAREVAASGKDGEATIVAMARALGMRRLGAASRGRLERVVGV